MSNTPRIITASRGGVAVPRRIGDNASLSAAGIAAATHTTPRPFPHDCTHRPQLPLSIASAPAIPGVYLLALFHHRAHVPYGADPKRPHAGAMHYAGWARDSIAARVREHATGQGSRLTLAAYLAGYSFQLVRVWPYAGRDTERAIKSSHRLAIHCPLCRFHIDPDPAMPAPVSALAACELFAELETVAAAACNGGDSVRE